MDDLASGPNYRIAADRLKNRLYFWFFGSIMKPEANARLGHDTREACGRMKPGFTALVDLMGLTMLGLPDMAQRFQSTLLKAGVTKVASVWDKASFSKIIVDSSAQKLGEDYAERRKTFFDRAEAETWLDG